MKAFIKESILNLKNALNSRRFHAKWEQDHLKKLLKHIQIDCVFDIGANQGQYAESLRKKIGFEGYIFSFEPNPIDFEILRKHAHHDAKWIVSNIAISDEDGVADFNVMQASQFSSLSKPSHSETEIFKKMNNIAKTISVKTERLETTLRRLQSQYNFHRPFLKMDTQGYDLNIFNGSLNIVKEFFGLQSELAIAKIYTDSVDFRDSITTYERNGFTLSAIVPNNSGHFPCLVEMDCIMIRTDLV